MTIQVVDGSYLKSRESWKTNQSVVLNTSHSDHNSVSLRSTCVLEESLFLFNRLLLSPSRHFITTAKSKVKRSQGQTLVQFVLQRNKLQQRKVQKRERE